MLRSTVALANVYYDFGLGGDFGYRRLPAAPSVMSAPVPVLPGTTPKSLPRLAVPVPTGGNVSAAAAVMVGVGYDMGTWVADVGYRGLYINQINNAADLTTGTTI